ncbi:hypothetical protein FRX31_013972 [Thalictrum thalictroides]|uniref:TF-B3 domain-containing protein n=1 Tax=Thalictrum thalictroides TaxID=46969 RepID=A0A7J6WGJ1_THATH|nr:hypothetical protein FRX31_013972 [Thalictrum thalictroides]
MAAMVVEEEDINAADHQDNQELLLAHQGAENLRYLNRKRLDVESAVALQTLIIFQPLVVPPIERLQGEVLGPCSFIKKFLTTSDVNNSQGRLLIKTKFAEEKINILLRKEDNPCKGIKVPVYDRSGNKVVMEYKHWPTKSYVLIDGWKDFYTNNRLEKDDEITLWAFRSRDWKLCFAIWWVDKIQN